MLDVVYVGFPKASRNVVDAGFGVLRSHVEPNGRGKRDYSITAQQLRICQSNIHVLKEQLREIAVIVVEGKLEGASPVVVLSLHTRVSLLNKPSTVIVSPLTMSELTPSLFYEKKSLSPSFFNPPHQWFFSSRFLNHVRE